MEFRLHIGTRARSLQPCLEIGPSYNPILPKAGGFDTTVYDELSKEGLLRKYASHPVDLQRIEEVDVVGGGLRSLSGRQFRAIVASHVIEHSLDLIAFLDDCAALLDPEGRLFMIVPDKRYCFDHFRPLSSTGHVLDAHFSKRGKHLGSVFDQHGSAVSRRGAIAWDATVKDEMKFVHSFEVAARALRDALETTEYYDSHEWVFTPSSFRLVLQDLNRLGFVTLAEDEFHPSKGGEFYVALKLGQAAPEPAREALLKMIHAELREV